MRLRFSHLPYVLTLIAMPLPWLVPFSTLDAITWTPEILALTAFVYLVSVEKVAPTFKTSHILIVLIFSAHLVGQLLSGIGIGGSAIISVMVMSLLFYLFFRSAPEDWVAERLIGQVSIIYVIHVCFILIEAILLSTGNTSILVTLSGGQYKPAQELFYGEVPQSLSNQSQAASQLCVFSATWFAMLYVSRKPLRIRFGLIYAAVLTASLAVFAVYPTTMILIVAIILVFCIVYLIPIAKSMFLRVLVLIVAGVSFEPVYEMIIYKFSQDLYSRAFEYQEAFLSPINAFFELPLSAKLLGVGSIGSIAKSGVQSADLGIGIVILQIGLVLGVFAIVALLFLVLRALRLGYHKHLNDPHVYRWVWLGSVSSLIVIGNLLSLFHYTVALQTGGRTLFSLHIAILMLSLQHLVRYRRSTIMAEATR